MAAAYALEATAIDLQEWNPATMEPNSVSLMVGARHSGKSVLLTDIMWHLRHKLDMVVGMSPTEPANKTFAQFTPPCFIYNDFDAEAIRNVLTWQRGMSEADEKAAEADPRARPRTWRTGLLLDDCASHGTRDKGGGKGGKQALKSDDIDTIIKLGRHWRMFMVLLVQYMKDAPPAVRGGVDYVFAFDTNVKKDRVKLYEDFFNINGIDSFHIFQAIFQGCVGVKHSCIVLDVRASRGGAPFAGVYYYRAVNRTRNSGHPRFRVGRSIFWRLSDHFFSRKHSAIELDPVKLRPDLYADAAPVTGTGTGKLPPDAPAAGTAAGTGKPHDGIVVRRVGTAAAVAAAAASATTAAAAKLAPLPRMHTHTHTHARGPPPLHSDAPPLHVRSTHAHAPRRDRV